MDIKVKEVQNLVTEWYQEMSNLQDQYTLLLYFSVPKILLLYKLLNSSCLEEGENCRVDNIFCEISFLVNNQLVEKEKLRSKVQVSIEVQLLL